MKFLKIRSRHPSHNSLRRLIKVNCNAVLRLGSQTLNSEIFPNLRSTAKIIEINTPTAVANSANKLLMKKCFTENNVKTADWWTYKKNIFHNFDNEVSDHSIENLPYPIVAKHIYGSRNRGNTLIANKQELENWMQNKALSNYIFEKYYSYSREYRLHVTEDGCFYTCRKMLKSDVPEDKRWYRNDSNSVWVLESNELFDKPINWESIVNECVKSLKSVGLDIGAVDLRVQSAEDRKKSGKVVHRASPEFIVVEINSAPSFGELTFERYANELPKLINKKSKII